MSEYVDSALFIYDASAEGLIRRVRDNGVGARVVSVSLESWLADPAPILTNVGHVVIAATMGRVKQLLLQSVEYGFSVGIVPIEGHKKMARYLNLPEPTIEAIDFALRKDPPAMDLVLVNDKVMLFRATFGWMPLFDEPAHLGRFQVVARALGKLVRIKLNRVRITTANGNVVKASATGCMLVQRHHGGLGSSLTERTTSVCDGAVASLINSPRSVLEYLRFLVEVMFPLIRGKRIPAGVGVVTSSGLRIEPEAERDVYIDGKLSTKTPLHCRILPAATRVNIGPALRKTHQQLDRSKDRIRTSNLPTERELTKVIGKRLPFFSYASEDRFRDLFKALRNDAQFTTNYVVLMVLSTVLATVGLYLNNAAVIIGAMLLAPLMAPLVSVSMGVLRADDELFLDAVRTTVSGIAIALLAAALTSLVFQHKHVTDEMLGRLNPTLPDLAVAIFSGIAAAYSKAYREISQNMAGVAIAVALVPPLAVAGIGIGRADPYIFTQAFLLFVTNLVGIILFATLTFRMLGYSPVVRSKRGLGIMLSLLVLISVPLSLSYDQIVDRIVFEQTLSTDRYVVNGKYLMIDKVQVGLLRGRDLLILDVVAREPLTRADLQLLKEKIKNQFSKPFYLHTNVVYLL